MIFKLMISQGALKSFSVSAANQSCNFHQQCQLTYSDVALAELSDFTQSWINGYKSCKTVPCTDQLSIHGTAGSHRPPTGCTKCCTGPSGVTYNPHG